MQTNDDLALDEMERIDRFYGSDREAWHLEADCLLFKCLMLNLSTETKKKIQDWFKNGKKHYA